MIFRKDSLLFYQSEIIYIVMATLCFTLIPTLGLGLSLAFAFLFIILIFVNCKLHSEFILIDETGILCQKSGKQLWKYAWEDIAELKKTSRFLMPSIDIIAYNQNRKPEQFAQINHYFQLNRVAKTAMKHYYKTEDGTL